jgi:hypothetical protein
MPDLATMPGVRIMGLPKSMMLWVREGWMRRFDR